MLSYQTTDQIVNLSFSKEFLQDRELIRLIEILRVKELISKSQATSESMMQLDEELKMTWWEENKFQFLSRIE